MPTNYSKEDIKEYWEAAPPGFRYGDSTNKRDFFNEISDFRYDSHPYIFDFASFEDYTGKDVLEIGVGAGSDFQKWAESGANATGIDLTSNAINLTNERLKLFNLASNTDLSVADVENLPFKSESFDLVYSFGVLMVPPDTRRALEEVYRVLKPSGELKIMVYGVPSWVGLLLQIRFGLLRGNLMYTQKEAIWEHLESTDQFGTKSFIENEIKTLLENVGFEITDTMRKLSPGDLLQIRFSERHEDSARYLSTVYQVLKFLYPSKIIKKIDSKEKYGTHLMITAKK